MMARVPATVDHQAFRDELLALLKKHGGELSAIEMLALAAHTVGQLIAFQDQRVTSRALALETVSRNIEAGNAEAMRSVMGKPQGNA